MILKKVPRQRVRIVTLELDFFPGGGKRSDHIRLRIKRHSVRAEHQISIAHDGMSLRGGEMVALVKINAVRLEDDRQSVRYLAQLLLRRPDVIRRRQQRENKQQPPETRRIFRHSLHHRMHPTLTNILRCQSITAFLQTNV